MYMYKDKRSCYQLEQGWAYYGQRAKTSPQTSLASPRKRIFSIQSTKILYDVIFSTWLLNNEGHRTLIFLKARRSICTPLNIKLVLYCHENVSRSCGQFEQTKKVWISVRNIILKLLETSFLIDLRKCIWFSLLANWKSFQNAANIRVNELNSGANPSNFKKWICNKMTYLNSEKRKKSLAMKKRLEELAPVADSVKLFFLCKQRIFPFFIIKLECWVTYRENSMK